MDRKKEMQENMSRFHGVLFLKTQFLNIVGFNDLVGQGGHIGLGSVFPDFRTGHQLPSHLDVAAVSGKEKLEGVELVPATKLLTDLRSVKEPEEIDCLS